MQSNLVGGWATPLKNMSSSIGMMIATQYEWENAKFMATIHHQPLNTAQGTQDSFFAHQGSTKNPWPQRWTLPFHGLSIADALHLPLVVVVTSSCTGHGSCRSPGMKIKEIPNKS